MQQAINHNLTLQPLIYVTIEVERALGLETILNNYHIICYEDSPIIDLLLARGVPVYSVVRSGAAAQVRKTTAAILASEFGKTTIQQITAGKRFYLQTFHPTEPFFFQAKLYDCQILNNQPAVAQDLTDKLAMVKTVSEAGISIPHAHIGLLRDFDYQKLMADWKTKALVVQNRKSHTGEGTYIVQSEAEWQELTAKSGGSEFKIAEFIQGEPWTINGCVIGDETLVAGLSYQITGIPELTNHPGSTVGNDWSYASSLPESIQAQIKQMTEKVGRLLGQRGYRGLFGIDVMVGGESVYLIEVNARQTANIPLQSHLELAGGLPPLALSHLAAFMELKPESAGPSEIGYLAGAQIFNRAKQETAVQQQVKIGEYRLQSDNSAHDFDHHTSLADVIFLDEEQDKPLIWQRNSYNVLDLNPGAMQLLAVAPGHYFENQELCRLQLRGGVINNGRISPWIIEALTAVATAQC